MKGWHANLAVGALGLTLGLTDSDSALGQFNLVVGALNLAFAGIGAWATRNG